MIGGAQIRAARALLDWSAGELAERSGVARMTVQRFERCEGLPPGWKSTMLAVKQTLEKAGIEFIGTPEKRPGVRLSVKNPNSVNQA